MHANGGDYAIATQQRAPADVALAALARRG